MRNELRTQKLLSLAELFSGDNVFRVPIYQRGFAWEDKQIDDLWDDIVNLSKLSASNSPKSKRKHYTGLLVLEKIGSENKNDIVSEDLEGLDGFYIVDGQQRITSLVIILSCICHHKKQNLDEHLILGRVNRFGYSELRNDGARNYFENRVYKNDDSTRPSDLYQKNISNMYKKIDEKLSNLNNDQINVIRNIILNDMAFNVFTVSKEFDVRLTFETMNNRGKSLTHLELLKNRLMYLANFFEDSKKSKPKSDLIREIDNAWGTIYQEFGNSSVPLSDDDFLKAHWSLVKTLDKRNNNGYVDDIFKKCFTVEKINEQKKTEGDDVVYTRLIPYVKDLSNFAKYWVFVNRPFDDGVGDKLKLNPTDRKWISRISRISSHHHIMTALAALTSKVLYIKTIDERVEFYKKFEKFLFINVHLSKTRRNDMSSIVTNIRELYMCDNKNNDAINSAFKSFKTKVFKETDAIRVDKKRVQYILENQFIEYSTGELDFYNWRGLKYFFYVYEDFMTPATQSFSWDDFDGPSSIEHIYPQNPSEESVGHIYWKKGFEKFYDNMNEEDKEKERYLITNVIGNLGLTSNSASNSSLSNHIYPIKSGHKTASKETKEQLQESYKYDRLNLKLVYENYEQWTPGTIIERTKDLLTFIKDTWLDDYFVADGEEVPTDNSKFPSTYWDKYLDNFIGSILQYRPKHTYKESKNLFDILQKLADNKKSIDESFNAKNSENNPAKNASLKDKQLNKVFWTAFNDYIRNNGNDYLFKEQVNSHPNYDCDVLPTLFNKCHLTMSFIRDKGLLQVMINIPNNKELFDDLKSHRHKIETDLEYKLVWERHAEEIKESTVYVESPNFAESIENNHFDEAFDWLIQTANKFIDVFTKYLSISTVPKVLKPTAKDF